MTKNIKQIGNYIFNISENIRSQALMGLVATDHRFEPEYSFTCNYLEPIEGFAENQIIIPHSADCRYYIAIVFNMNQPSIDVDQCIDQIYSFPKIGPVDDKINYVIKKKWIINQDVYCLYEASQIAGYLSKLELSIQFNETEYQKLIINNMSLISTEMFFNTEVFTSRTLNHQIADTKKVTGKNFRLICDDYISCVFFDQQPSHVVVNLCNTSTVYDNQLLNFMKNIADSEKFCIPFYLPTFGSNCLVCRRLDICDIEFFFDQTVDVTFEVETLNQSLGTSNRSTNIQELELSTDIDESE